MFKKVIKIVALLFAGFVGGSLAPWILGWLQKVKVDSTGDAISIANTYIVFTTIIFVGVTVILAVAGYVFTQQFSASKSAQEHELLEELKERIKSDEKLGISLANSILQNPDVRRHLDGLMEGKLSELVGARLADTQAAAKQAAEESQAVASLAGQLNGKGG